MHNFTAPGTVSWSLTSLLPAANPIIARNRIIVSRHAFLTRFRSFDATFAPQGNGKRALERASGGRPPFIDSQTQAMSRCWLLHGGGVECFSSNFLGCLAKASTFPTQAASCKH
jgi:hypothetical protein